MFKLRSSKESIKRNERAIPSAIKSCTLMTMTMKIMSSKIEHPTFSNKPLKSN